MEVAPWHRCAKAGAGISVNIAAVVVVVSAKVRLEAVRAVGEEVVIGLVVGRAVVGIDGAFGIVIRDDEIVMDVAVGGDNRGLASPQRRDVRDPVVACQHSNLQTLS